MKHRIHNKFKYKERRQDLRNNATDAEQMLWQKLKGKQLGVKFRRQHGIGDYIVDFYCPTSRLVVELDGSQHYQMQEIEYDKQRTEYLNHLNITVKRYTNCSVLTEIGAVLADILSVLSLLNPEN